MKKKIHPAVSEFYRKKGREGGIKSAKMREEKIIREAEEKSKTKNK